jgi:hypothetical protein
MRDFTAERTRLQQKHTENLAGLELEERIVSALPEGLTAIPWRYHAGSLYGTSGHLYADHDFYRYGDTKAGIPQPTIDTIGELARAFPALPLVKIRAGCLSFQPRAYVDSLPETKKERWDEEQDVAPFLLKIDGFQRRTYEIEWTATIAGEITRISIKLPLPYQAENRIGQLEIRYQEYKGGRRVDRCTFVPASNLRELFREGEPVAQLETPIRWAAGGEDTPNSFTCYWIALRAEDEYAPTVGDLVRAISGDPA